MNRLKLLTMATLMALTITACDEGTQPPVDVPPPPTPAGTISGTVTIDGTGATGITATLSSGATTATGAGGTFSFAGVEAGSYTVTISGYPADAAFPSATQAATIASDGQTVQLNFAGEYIRSSSVVGSVVAADPMMMGSDSNGDMLELRPELLLDMLDGITVTLEGENTMAEPQSTMEGGFAFTGLRAGSYTVTISGYPEDVKFDEASMTVEVGVGEVGMADFEGAYIRTAAVEGRVIIEGEGLAGVTVTLTGGPGNDSYTKLTGANGEYAFTELRPGDYQINISGYDPDEYEFASSSHDVSVELDETETVSFTGVLLRTSGISGRVSGGGEGLADITVTLSGAADDTTMTDASGQYAFSGLAAGDYTVSIAVESAAYVFDSMSETRTVGDDDSQIVNFEGAHDTSANLTAMLFIDEAAKNDLYDEGEDAFPSAAMLQALQAAGVQLPPVLPVPVTLVGPVLGEMRTGSLDLATGQISFAMLRAGTYQLQVGSLAALLPGLPAAAVAVLQDFEYGGPADGYAITIGVAETATQAIPVDITHTTAHFVVTLKAGEDRGMMPVPGAMVTLYSGETEVGSGETGENGEAAVIRFARAGTGGMVNAGVAVDGYHVAEGMTPVSWDAKIPYTQATNANDIVNLNADFSFKGATVGGGTPLAGWAISVTSGGNAVAAAPAVLGADGSASFSEAVAASDLSKTYTITVADDQTGKDGEGKELDGGENYTAASLEHVHNGLSLAGGEAADAGTLEVTYTTQTLNVFVHEENDQVMGYTGNVLGGDVRMSGVLDVELRYVQNGYRHQFAATDSVKSSNAAGVYTFSNVPADKNVIVTADKVSDTLDIMVLDPDEVAASGFGSQGGGSHHTVELCSMQPVEGQQRHDGCATFAYVHIYAVDGQAWKNVVTKSGDDFAKDVAGADVVTTQGEPGLKVSLDPVEGENLAGESDFFLAEKAGDKKFDFGQIAAGVYSLTLSDSVNWGAKRGPADDPSDDLKTRLSPLDSALNVDVTPKTGYIFGTVTDDGGRRAAGVAVDVNGESAVTDEQGRYIVEGFGPASYRAPNATRASRNRSVVRAFDPGTGGMKVMSAIAFAANTPKREDFSVAQATDIAAVSGRVTHSGTGSGVGGVEILVDYGTGAIVPLNAPYVTVPDPARPGRTKQVRMLLTGADGSYTARVSATGSTVAISAKKEFMFFTPDKHSVSAVVGAQISGINFSAFDNGTITGRVVDAADTTIALSDVIVEARPVSGAGSAATAVATHADTTGATGTYTLRVPYGSYNVTAKKNGYELGLGISNVSVPNDGRPIANIKGTADQANAELSNLHLSGVTFTDAAGKAVKFSGTTTAYTATVGNAVAMTTVTATVAVAGATVAIDPADASTASGHQVELEVDVNDITVTVTPADKSSPTKDYAVAVTRRAPSAMIEGTVTDANSVGISGVTITVGGKAPLNATGSPKALKTASDGTYSAEVESGSAVDVTPSKTGLSFDPASRSVTPVSNATITGIDFTGSGNASIRGRVVDGNEAPLAGATVTASPRGGSGGPTATTRTSGTFTIRNVPIGWATVSVTKDGYSFAKRDVFVTGGTIDIGDLEALGTIQPTAVMAARDTANRSFDGMVTVTWSAGASDAEEEVSYQVQSCVLADAANGEPAVTCVADGWENFSQSVLSTATTYEATAAVADSDGGFKVRVQASVTGGDPVNSAVVNVAAINVKPSLVSAVRDIDPAPDQLVVKWNGDRAATTTARIVGGFTSNGTTTWVVLSTNAFDQDGYVVGATAANPDHQFSFGFQSADLLTGAVVDPANGKPALDTNGAAIPDRELTVAEMNGQFMVRVQARQPSIDVEVVAGAENVDVWKASGPATINDKP